MKTMKTIKVSESTGAALDWLVAKCEGINPLIRHYKTKPGAALYSNGGATIPLEYSANWAQGGPIKERERIWTRTTDEGEDDPECLWRAELPYRAVEVGPTELVAAMRCYVTSKLGEKAEIPEELL
jgi:hypothetical protein